MSKVQGVRVLVERNVGGFSTTMGSDRAWILTLQDYNPATQKWETVNGPAFRKLARGPISAKVKAWWMLKIHGAPRQFEVTP